MKLFLNLFLATILCFGTTAFASSDTHRAAAEEMLLASGVDKVLDPMMQQIVNMMEGQFEQLDIPESKKAILEKYNKKAINLIFDEFKWENFKDQFVDIYVNVYTENEIRDLTKFYKSPIGQKLMEKMPELMQESMRISQQRVQELMPKLMQITEEMKAEIQKTAQN